MVFPMRYFPFGRAAFTFLILAVASASWLGWRSFEDGRSKLPPGTITLTYWTFARTHYDAYRRAIPGFETAHPGVHVDVQLVSNDGLAARLQDAFLANLDVPDLCDVEISSSGTFFRGPLKDVGWLDLTSRIHRSGLWDKLVRARLAPYTDRGHIFGLPHDVHPVMIAYRRDIFEQAGVDAASLTTWADFIRAGRKITIPGQRYMLELSDSAADQLEVCLFQRGGGYFDPHGKCIMDNQAAIDTLCWYVPLVAGPHPVGNNLGAGQVLTKAVEDGFLVCMFCPDWRSLFIEQDIPRVSGKMALMPMPAVYPGGKRTSTWGGTMLGITRHCKHPNLAWELAMYLYLDKSQLDQRFRETHILPPIPSYWSLPAFHHRDPYYSNQRIGELYAKLAPLVPFQYTSPFIGVAKSKMSEALAACVQHYDAYPDQDLRPYAEAQLHRAADYVRLLMARNPY